jgi:hypothetical protein
MRKKRLRETRPMQEEDEGSEEESWLSGAEPENENS